MAGVKGGKRKSLLGEDYDDCHSEVSSAIMGQDECGYALPGMFDKSPREQDSNFNDTESVVLSEGTIQGR